MNIKLYPPFSEDVGKDWVQISLKETITTRQLLSLLFERFSVLEKYRSSDSEEPFYNFILFKDGVILRLEDAVSDEDTISITLPLTGG